MTNYQCSVRKIALEYIVTKIDSWNKKNFTTLLEALTFVRNLRYTFYIVYPEIKISEEIDAFRALLKDIRQRAVWWVHFILIKKHDYPLPIPIPTISE